MLSSKVKEALICIRAGRVTLGYPFAPHNPAGGFRGRPIVDGDLCIGCGGCAAVCPAGVILLRDPDRETRIVQFQWSRCTYCGRCADVCPEDAVTMSPDFETATDSAADMVLEVEVFMGPCGRCGRCFETSNIFESLPMRGFRADDTESRPGAWLGA